MSFNNAANMNLYRTEQNRTKHALILPKSIHSQWSWKTFAWKEKYT